MLTTSTRPIVVLRISLLIFVPLSYKFFSFFRLIWIASRAEARREQLSALGAVSHSHKTESHARTRAHAAATIRNSDRLLPLNGYYCEHPFLFYHLLVEQLKCLCVIHLLLFYLHFRLTRSRHFFSVPFGRRHSYFISFGMRRFRNFIWFRVIHSIDRRLCRRKRDWGRECEVRGRLTTVNSSSIEEPSQCHKKSRENSIRNCLIGLPINAAV